MVCEDNTKQRIQSKKNKCTCIKIYCWHFCCPGQIFILFKKPGHSVQKLTPSVWSRKKMMATHFQWMYNWSLVHQPTNRNIGFKKNITLLVVPAPTSPLFLNIIHTYLRSWFCFRHFFTIAVHVYPALFLLNAKKKLQGINGRGLFIEDEIKAAEKVITRLQKREQKQERG